MHQLRSTTVYAIKNERRGTISKGDSGRSRVSKQTGTYRPTLFANARPIKTRCRPTMSLAETRSTRFTGLLRLSRLLWPSVLLKCEKLLRAESFIVDLSRSLDQVLQVSPEKKVVIRIRCCARRSYACFLTSSGNCAGTRTRNVSRPRHLPHPSGFSVRAQPSHR